MYNTFVNICQYVLKHVIVSTDGKNFLHFYNNLRLTYVLQIANIVIRLNTKVERRKTAKENIKVFLLGICTITGVAGNRHA